MINSNSKILFLCPSFNLPIGGVKQIYRQVDVLNSVGFDAYVLHPFFYSKETWFENKTRVLYNQSAFKKTSIVPEYNFKGKIYTIFKKYINKGKNDWKNTFKPDLFFETQIGQSDLLVYPEVYAHALASNFANNKFLVYAQGCFILFKDIKDISQTVYQHKNLLGVMVNSTYSYEYIKFLFPNINLRKIHHFINPLIFANQGTKKKQIVLSSKKLPNDASQIINIFNLSMYAQHWSLVDISENNSSHKHSYIAEILLESAIYINLVTAEGFGLPAAEAMSSGCLVIGYPGYGGLDYMSGEFTFPIREGDVIALMKTLFEVLQNLDNKPTAYNEMLLHSKSFISQTYSEENEKTDIKDFWNKIV